MGMEVKTKLKLKPSEAIGLELVDASEAMKKAEDINKLKTPDKAPDKAFDKTLPVKALQIKKAIPKADPKVEQTSQPENANAGTLYSKQLRLITGQIDAADNIEEVLLSSSDAICSLLNADRLTVYLIGEDKSLLSATVMMGLSSRKKLKVPITIQSIAGYVALRHQALNIADVYDEKELAKIHPDLNFLNEVDKRSGYKTCQMMVSPIMGGGTLYGVMQVINSRHNKMFSESDNDAVGQLCQTIGTALHRQLTKGIEAPVNVKSTKYDDLIASKVITQHDLQQCIAMAHSSNQSVEAVLLGGYQVTTTQIGESLAVYFKVGYEPFKMARLRTEALHGQLKINFIEQQGWLPLESLAEGLVVMCLDPEAVRASRMVPQVFAREAQLIYKVTTQEEFNETVIQLFGSTEDTGSINQMLAGMSVDAEAEDDSIVETAASDNEIVKFVNKVIVDAFNQKASDIHIEPLPRKGATGIRFRIDGTLYPYIEVPAHFRQAVITRLKIMADLDISEKRKPQDGKIRFNKFGPLQIELRVATIPSSGGVEDVVMRILFSGEPLSVDQLALSENNSARLLSVIDKPYGLFYVCGPTGSGKTTTLHSILKHLNTPDTKIWTAEDPVEITQKGLRQVQVNYKAGIDFAMVMRSFLRADPDIIMVGESRDKETVSISVEASLTGHRVFSTLHTNSAPESITRLLDMGMDPFNFADALLGVLAQRLAKKLCDCKEPYSPEPAEVDALITEYSEELRHTDDWRIDPDGQAEKLKSEWVKKFGNDGKLMFHQPIGCAKCGNTGYKGRVGLHELMIADDDLKRNIQERSRVSVLLASAVKNGMHTLKMDGIEKMLQGYTDMKMIRAVCIK